MSQVINRTIEFKLYPNTEQSKTLDSWLAKCCWVYNRCLEHRIKAHKRRKQSIKYNYQQALLTQWRSRMEWLRLIPVQFSRDAIRRVDRGMKAFFRRITNGEKPGFPRFKKRERYRSLEQIQPGQFVRGKTVFVPGIGNVRARGQVGIDGRQIGIIIIKRARGWFAKVLMEIAMPEPVAPTEQDCGIDVGLESFATFDDGSQIVNSRHLRKSSKKLKRAQQRLSRCQRGSNRRKKAVNRVARLHEKVARQRRGFCHRISRDIVNRFDRIAVEKLNVKGLASGMLAKSVKDAAWGIFLNMLRYKAESAGRVVVEVDPSGTSQTCPQCGAVAKKELSERTHRCKGCGFECHRDVAAAMVIRQRAFRSVRGGPIRPCESEAGPEKREGDSR